QKQGYNLDNNNVAFYWTGAGTPGDSGSSVLSDDLRAIGVLTHLGVFGSTSDNGGTHLDRGMQLAADKGGFTHLRLVLTGEDPVALYHEMQANASRANATIPTIPTPTQSNVTGANVTPDANATAPASTSGGE